MGPTMQILTQLHFCVWRQGVGVPRYREGPCFFYPHQHPKLSSPRARMVVARAWPGEGRKPVSYGRGPPSRGLAFPVSLRPGTINTGFSAISPQGAPRLC